MKKTLLACSIAAATAAGSQTAHAFRFDTEGDWAVRWDNTLKGNLMSRVAKQDPDIYDPDKSGTTAQAADDADYSVDRGNGGLVSARIDLLSELDVVWRDDYGFRVSGAGWYDFAYEDSNHPKSGPTLGFPSAYSTWGALSVQPGNYTDDAEDLHYRGGELLDAFVFGNFTIGDVGANIRAGRHTLYWGQSLLSKGAIHGFAGSMAALDLAKGLGSPGSEAKELFMPNGKVSTVVQFTEKLTLNAYYAYEFVPLRWPEYGTYFSLAEVLSEHSEFFVVAPGGVDTPRAGLKRNDYKANDSGDWGLNLQYYIEPWGLETSFIYINATDRTSSGLYTTQGDVTDKERALGLETNAAVIGHYGWVYKSDIDTFGFSLSKEMGGISWGADFVYRKDMALNPSSTAAVFSPLASAADTDPDNYHGATGDTMHVVLNGLGFLNGDWGLWDGGTYIVEATFSKLDDWGQNEFLANPFIHEDRWVTGIAGVFKPTWYQVYPGWDLSLLMSVSYGVDGEQSPNSVGENEEVGNGSLGFEFLIDQQWLFSANYNVYYGPVANGTSAYIKDRDNISLTLKRTF